MSTPFKNPQMPIYTAFFSESQEFFERQAHTTKGFVIPSAWIDFSAAELKVLAELVRSSKGNTSEPLSLGSLARSSGLPTASRLLSLFDVLVIRHVILWRKITSVPPHTSNLPPNFLQVDIYERPDWWVAANGDEWAASLDEAGRSQVRAPSFIYFFRGSQTGLIKIGRSIDPPTRLRAVQSLAVRS